MITIEITGLTMHCERDYHTCGSFWDYICGYNDVNSFLQWIVCHWTLINLNQCEDGIVFGMAHQ